MHRKQNVESRYFNQLIFNETDHSVTKTSRHEAKLIEEIRWYLLIPGSLKKYVPTIRQFSLDAGQVSLVMERISGPSLSEMYVSGLLTESEWRTCFRSILKLMEAFADHQGDYDKQSLIEIYLYKTERRIRQMVDQHDRIRSYVSKGSFELNGDGIVCPVRMFKQHEADIRALADFSKTHIIHGDLCFSNMFYSPRTKTLKLIDPRGSFGRHRIYGDPRYDLAKIRHSLNGYDCIIANAFTLTADDNGINLELVQPPLRRELLTCWDEHIRPDLPQIRLIESLLFLSMIPLHADQPKRQLAMYAMSALLMKEALK